MRDIMAVPYWTKRDLSFSTKTVDIREAVSLISAVAALTRIIMLVSSCSGGEGCGAWRNVRHGRMAIFFQALAVSSSQRLEKTKLKFIREGEHGYKVGRTRRRSRRSKSELTIPKRASATATSLQGRLRVSKRRGGGGGKARNIGVRERNLSIPVHMVHLLAMHSCSVQSALAQTFAHCHSYLVHSGRPPQDYLVVALKQKLAVEHWHQRPFAWQVCAAGIHELEWKHYSAWQGHHATSSSSG
jgi:hypothetical protein